MCFVVLLPIGFLVRLSFVQTKLLAQIQNAVGTCLVSGVDEGGEEHKWQPGAGAIKADEDSKVAGVSELGPEGEDNVVKEDDPPTPGDVEEAASCLAEVLQDL